MRMRDPHLAPTHVNVCGSTIFPILDTDILSLIIKALKLTFSLSVFVALGQQLAAHFVLERQLPQCP
jgi:hypothetical protein